MISAVLHTDPACPWAYSAIPALRALDWRYGDQLQWRLVVIGLTEHADAGARERGYTPLGAAAGRAGFRDRFGMPLAASPKARMAAHARARAASIAAARLDAPGSEWRVLRALQLANFTTPMLLDEDRDLAAALREVPGVDGAALVARIDDADVIAAYDRDRAEARTAAGSPAELQGKTAVDRRPRPLHGAVARPRARRRRGWSAGGWQPRRGLRRPGREPRLRPASGEPPPDGPEPLLRALP